MYVSAPRTDQRHSVTEMTQITTLQDPFFPKRMRAAPLARSNAEPPP
jgi:hypothetical protein